ncbi:MAG: hypothetical protein KatS3mg027_2048 [Bacteroidia bacterium]|nr:MAG: hypothetical protein KatS3mg027_2048 [Bacteroidia bacterium]
MSNNQKIWIFIIEQQVSEGQLESIKKACLDFIHQWTSHDAPLKASFELFKNRLLIFKNDESFNPIGGCATDKLFHFIQKLEKEFNINLLNRQLVVYENNGELKVESLDKIDELIQKGVINENTIIYDTSINHSSEWDKFARKFSESWLQHILQ